MVSTGMDELVISKKGFTLIANGLDSTLGGDRRMWFRNVPEDDLVSLTKN